MDNISYVIFTVSGPKDFKANKYVYFAFTIMVYFLIILFNLTLIVTIIRERALHEPMYIFLCNLCFNGLYGTAGFYPKFISDILHETYVISYTWCFLQAFVIYTSSMCEYTTLVVMAYDRYVAICKPLEYHSIMTTRAIVKLLVFCWVFPFIAMSNAIVLASRLPLCGFHIDRLYCDNWSVVKLSCVPTTTNNIYGFVVIMLFMAHAVFIVYSYMKLVHACQKSKENKNKFMQTCMPHLLSLINFTIAVLFDVMFSRYGSRDFPNSVRDFLQLEILLFPPLFDPVIYGLKLTEIRKRVLQKHKERKINVSRPKRN
ncbi:olfactory receptor 52D1-like [Conger conger]|uniref:olfactory receptor 52D1-like n=1 Tax=Conger conger TaxID=82655 RepID=UPI002A5A43E3|nr:olfactory receptor 52D1-like [Conger conger]